MNRPRPLERSVALCGLLLIVLQVAGSAVPASGRDQAAANPATDAASEGGCRYYRTVWRPWPGEVRPDVSFPQSIGAEVIVTPAGEKQELPSKIRLLPGESPGEGGPLPRQHSLPVPVLPEPPIEIPGAPRIESLPGLPLEEPAEPPVKTPVEAPLQGTSLMVSPRPASLLGLWLLAQVNGNASKSGPPASGEVSHAASLASAVPTRANSGLLTVYVPYDAKVTINGLSTRSRGSRRRYVSHGLNADLGYKYEIRARVVRDGEAVEDVRTVTLTAGDRRVVSFGFNRVPIEGLVSAPAW